MDFEMYTKNQQEKIVSRARKIIYKVRDRCLNKNFKQYNDYGGKGVTISEDWLDTDKFAHDVVNLPGWDYTLFVDGKLELDKDFIKHDNLVYCKEYCALLTRKENMQFRPKVHKPFYAYNQYTQEIKEHFNAKMFADENDCSANVAWSVLQGKKHRTGDWYLWYKGDPAPIVERVYAVKDGETRWEINTQKLSLSLGFHDKSCAQALTRGNGKLYDWTVYKEKVDVDSLVEKFESNKMPNDYRTVTFYREDTKGNLVEYTFKVEM